MSVFIRLIDPKYHHQTDKDGDFTYKDGTPNERLGPMVYGYSISVGGVLSISVNGITPDGNRYSFTDDEFGPMAWASVYGTEQARIEAMSLGELRDRIDESS